MTQTVTNAVARTEQSKEVAKLVSSYKDRFALILPSHLGPDTFTSLALSALRRPDIAQAAMNDPMSLVTALTQCARLGHQPNTEAFYLVPIKNRVEGWEGYRGVVERMYRAGGVSSIHGAVVHAKDFYEYEEGMPHPIHRFTRFASLAERGERIGSFAYAKLRDGGHSKVVESSAEVIKAHRDANSSSGGASSPWQKWPDSMWLKVPARELEKWVPSSSAYRQQLALSSAAAAELAREEGLPEPAEGSFVDGEVVDWPETAKVGGGN